MAAPPPDVLAEWLLEEASNREFRSVQEVLQIALSFRMRENSPEENAELSERSALPLIEELENRVAIDRSDGVTPAFEISSEGKTAYFRVLDAPELPALKKLRAIPPKKFECFCSEILSRLGAKASVEGGPYDGGVDFVAINLQLGENVGIAPRASKALVIGQAKRYKEGNNLTVCDLREFIGGAILRADRLRASNIHDAGILTPIIYAYWTTADFHHEAKKYARAMGMWYLNGVGLAQLAGRVKLNLEEYLLS